MGPQGGVRVAGCPEMKGEREEWGEEKRGGEGGLDVRKETEGERARGESLGIRESRGGF